MAPSRFLRRTLIDVQDDDATVYVVITDGAGQTLEASTHTASVSRAHCDWLETPAANDDWGAWAPPTLDP